MQVGTRTDAGALRGATLVEVELFVGQSTAQHSLAAAISGLSFAIKAALQQSIMPCMLHSPSPKCRGIPAKVLPASTSNRNKDASRFFMFATLYSELIIAVNLGPWARRWAMLPTLWRPQASCPNFVRFSFTSQGRLCGISRCACEELRLGLMTGNPTY